MSRERILVVDDEEIARENLVHSLTKAGYRAAAAADGRQALAVLAEEPCDLVLTDLRMPEMDGMELLAAIKRRYPEVEVIVVTGHAAVDSAVAAMRLGAFTYVAKPVQVAEVLAQAAKALEKSAMRRELASLKRKVDPASGLSRLIGQSAAMEALRESIVQVARLECNVLITGETGTGKELVARTVHDLSPRCEGRFMAVNCGAFSEELISNELFGHEREAFTGAAARRKGLIEAASGGTLFLDEIGELPLTMQVKLLRVLQERTFLRVGGTEEAPMDARVLSATNKDLKKEAETGAFRQDLFYRLDVVTLHVPPLAQRREDIPQLARHFLAKHAGQACREVALSPEVLDRLLLYEYPGNVRELENIIQKALTMCDGDVIRPEHLLADLRDEGVRPTRSAARQEWPSLEEHEKNYIRDVLEEVEGNKSKAARVLAIDRVSLWRKLKRYGLE
ncbi:sigma-54-dependent transcriptional regulator [Solidesulfovibrio alcoholivorans]|uniref:sigma-54-dependent transcriptional regulator n=1 Tax=Solidesulfovibrio alcoholivorans TaxID=81406 RepID=UPI000497A831|nr:sigma-54 dependent transcriptional regulator [Solidesulfovibrio alcoholivorans]